MLARRARIGQAVSVGKGVGYACFGGALVLFFVGLLTRFGGPLSAVVVTLLVIGCLVLPPAIVFGYGLRAAEREERADAAARRSAPADGATDGATDGTTGGTDQAADQG